MSDSGEGAMTRAIAELDPDDRSLLASLYERPDYRDRFATNVEAGQYGDVDEVVTAWFEKQPTWLRLASTNTLSKKGVEAATRRGGYEQGSKVGSWEVIARDREEIVFGDNMGFMEYRFSIRLLRAEVDTVEAATSVKYRWRRASRLYFAPVRPIHRRFIKKMLALTVQ